MPPEGYDPTEYGDHGELYTTLQPILHHLI